MPKRYAGEPIRPKPAGSSTKKEHANNFVDVIKIVAFGERRNLTIDEMKAIVETAHEHRLKVTAHATVDVFRTATYHASIALGKKDEVDILKGNANADLVVFDGDPEKDFSKVLFTWHG